MSIVFIESFKDGEKTVWGLYYPDYKGEKIPVKENWKHLAYDSEKAAILKLKQIGMECEREKAAVEKNPELSELDYIQWLF